MSVIGAYLRETARVVEAMGEPDIRRVAAVFEAARRDGRRIFIFGNGGSGSLASHLACDFNKGCSPEGRKPFRVVSLVDNLPLITAYGNDVDYTSVFTEQMRNLWEPGDVAVGISGSGRSANVVRALEWAGEHGGTTVGFTAFGGGRVAELVDVAVVADTYDMQHAEDAHVVLMHLLMQLFAGDAPLVDALLEPPHEVEPDHEPADGDGPNHPVD